MRFALNPLQFYATEDGSLAFDDGPTYESVLEAVRDAHFDAVQLDRIVRPPAEHLAMLGGYGIRPAPGYFSAALHDRSQADDIDSRFAATAKRFAALGLDRAIIGPQLTPERMATAGRHAGKIPPAEVIAAAAERLGRLIEIGRPHGIAVCLHPHVGSVIESEEEIEALLECASPNLLLCPDTGHLAWGGTRDVARFIEGYCNRIGVLHLKDVDLGVVGRGVAEGWDYRAFVRAGVWREPGDGDLDLRRICAGLEASDIWCIVEVDRAFLPTPQASLAACRAFVESLGSYLRVPSGLQTNM